MSSPAHLKLPLLHAAQSAIEPYPAETLYSSETVISFTLRRYDFLLVSIRSEDATVENVETAMSKLSVGTVGIEELVIVNDFASSVLTLRAHVGLN